MFHSNHGPISYRFRDLMAISVDNCKISPYLRIKNTLAEGFPWNWVTMEGLKKLEWWGYLAMMIISAVCITYTSVSDGQTDGYL